MLNTRSNIALIILTSCIALAACGEQITTIHPQHMQDDSGFNDMPADLGQDMTLDAKQDLSTRDSPKDIPTEDMSEDMPSLDMTMDMGMDMVPDMTVTPYVGMTCTQGNASGVCLEMTSTCRGTVLNGACGQSAFQCCVQSCQVGNQTGQCSEMSQCTGISTPGLCPGPSNVQCCTPNDPTNIGQSVGSVWNTYYYLAQEANYSGSSDTALNDSNCDQLLKVSAAFSDAVCIEGSGQLKDGRVINYAKTCNCGRLCPTGGIVCYSILDANRFPWGKGNRNNPLDPLRSLAVDRNRFANGTVLYLKEFDGLVIPQVGTLGGFTHDGCFRADDVGGGIKNEHIDIFTGTPAMRQALERIFPTRTNFSAYKDTPKCQYLK